MKTATRARAFRVRSPRGLATVQSVDRALALLEILARHDDRVSLTELSRQLGLHPSTARRLLIALQARGFVQQDARTRLYGLGLRIFRLAGSADYTAAMRNAAHAHLRKLAESSGETVNLLVPDTAGAMIIDRIESSMTVRFSVPVGERLPYHCTAGGKVLLAQITPEVQQRILARALPRLTKNTITDVTRLREELERIRKRGYAIDNEEREAGVRCVAAPVTDHTGAVVAAVSLSGPASRLSLERLHRLALTVRRTAENISRQQGSRAE